MKPIIGFEHYSISEDGKVFNNKTGRELKQHTNQCGYFFITLRSSGVKKSLSIHRLVALAYVSGYSSGLVVNHIDGNKKK